MKASSKHKNIQIMNTPNPASTSSYRPKRLWNPFSGCQPVSAGCRFCYAKAIATSQRGGCGFPNGFKLTTYPERLDQPRHIKTPSLFFVSSMSDLFWDQVPQATVDAVIEVIASTPWHAYEILTKRPERMLEYSLRHPFPDNVLAGVTIENQDAAWRLDVLRDVKAKTRFLSCEPLLSPLKLDWSAVDWVLAGGESGPHLHDPAVCAQRGLVEKVVGAWTPRADRINWVRDIRDACLAAGTPFFHKQWGGSWYDRSNNLLDGRRWEQFPDILKIPTSPPAPPEDGQLLLWG